MGVYAITGSLGCGKTSVIQLFERKGAVVFDSDARIHRIYKQRKGKIYRSIAKAFPQAVKDGKISRSKLGKIVFAQRASLAKLEKIIHPVIIEDLKKWIQAARKKKGVFVAEVALLFEKKLENIFEKVIVVYVQKSILIPRIEEKFSLSRTEALKRLSLTLSLKEKTRRADFVIDNSFGRKKLRKEVDILWKKLTKKN